METAEFAVLTVNHSMNRMKSLFSFVLFLFQLTSLHAQVDVAWGGQQIANPKNSEISSIVGSDEGHLYVLKEKNGHWGHRTRYYLDSYTRKTLAFSGSTEFNLPQLNERSNVLDRMFSGAGKYQEAFLEKMIFINGHFFLFSSYYSREQDKNFAYVQSLTEKGTPGKAFTGIDTIGADDKRNKGSFGFVVSEKEKHILIIHAEPTGRNNFSRFSCKVFDPDMNLQWSKMLDMPHPDNQFHLVKTAVDSNGNIFLLANIDKDKDWMNSNKHKPAFSYSILAYYPAHNQLKEYTIDLDDKFISDITFKINPAGDLICTGFYSKSSETSQAGCFFVKIDTQTTEVAEHSVKEFGKDFLLDFMSDRKAEKGRELYNFNIDHLLLREDGSAIMVAEQYFMDMVSYYNPASHSYNYSYHYYYNDILVLGFDPKGELTLQKKISKYQHSVNDQGPYASFVLADGGTMLHFIYNDNPENIRRTESEIGKGHLTSMSDPSHSVVVMVSMDMKGNTQRTQLLDNHSSKSHSWFMPKMNKKINDREVILFAHKGRYFRFGRISL
ncbi:MAG TPA: hypothetical protein VNZ86_11030 [Bacteroidia bacterium]|nr:hypothetical protein [Bacteroidia bacterium]